MGISGNILIVDDEATLRQTLTRILQRANIKATAVGSGQEGLTILSQQTFDLVYLDYRMPDMSGMEVLKIIHARFPDLPVILFTAQPDVNSAVGALRHGATDYLLKPLQPQALIERTQSILEAREKERRKREVQAQIEVLQAELRKLESDQESQPEPASQAANAGERFLNYGKLSLDLHTHRLVVNGRTVSLPPATFDYLIVLVRHAPNVVDYQTLVTEAQGYQVESREAQELVKWHVHHIRQAIEPDVREPVYLINVRGIGYRLVAS
ncbi:MAG: response regulator transcription factor [Anaerolineales bacterium]